MKTEIQSGVLVIPLTVSKSDRRLCKRCIFHESQGLRLHVLCPEAQCTPGHRADGLQVAFALAEAAPVEKGEEL